MLLSILEDKKTAATISLHSGQLKYLLWIFDGRTLEVIDPCRDRRGSAPEYKVVGYSGMRSIRFKRDSPLRGPCFDN